MTDKRTWSANNEPLNETDARLNEFDRRLRVLEDILFRATAMAEATRKAASAPKPATPETSFDGADDMCPNCVTPWKCNGPHLDNQTARAKRAKP